MNYLSATAFADTKPHYHLLDGLRGMAALLVVIFHILEGFATTVTVDATGEVRASYVMGHGYLAVDFFFMLSGFVIGYAYDDRLYSRKMTVGDFFRRRIIRLQPMAVMGTLIGAACFYAGSCEAVPMVAETPVWKLALLTLLGCCMVPAVTACDIRGYGEMYPLNGPAWSLFFEYAAYVAYALFIRRLGTKALILWTAMAGIGLCGFAIRYGDVCYGFSFAGANFPFGMLKVMFSFSMGLLLSRNLHKVPVRGAFWICTAILAAVFTMPRLGGGHEAWMNGLYDFLCIALVFPVVICLAASGTTTDKASTRICTFCGDISFPLYMIHYPFIYLYIAYFTNNGLGFMQTLPVAATLLAGCILLAYGCLRWYDTPVRRRLGQRWLHK